MDLNEGETEAAFCTPCLQGRQSSPLEGLLEAPESPEEAALVARESAPEATNSRVP